MSNITHGYELKSHINNGVLVIAPEGNLLSGEDHKPVQELLNIHLASGINKVLFNLAHVLSMNSEGLGILLMALAKVKHRGGRIAVCHLPEGGNRLLEITKLDSIIAELPSEEEGIAFLKSRNAR